MTYQEMEKTFADLLTLHDIRHEHEGQVVRRGGKASKGKCDFILHGCKYGSIELKTVQRLTRATYPRPGIKCPLIKTHQLKALRSHNGGVLIYDEESAQYYFMTVQDLDHIIIEHGLVKSLKGYMNHLAIDLDEFVTKLKG